MTHAEALAHLRAMLSGAQKARSITLESVGDTLSESDLAPISRWLFGPGCIVPALAKAVTAAEHGEPIDGSTFRQFIYVATQLEPSIAMCAINYASAEHGDVLPDPDITWTGQTWVA